MPVLNVAFVGSESLARKIAKKGDVRDIESYVHKEEKNGEMRIISLLRPLKPVSYTHLTLPTKA